MRSFVRLTGPARPRRGAGSGRIPLLMERWLRAIRWLALAGWFGSWALCALVVAPTAFRVLPSATEAGALVGPVLRSLHLYGLFAGAFLFAITFAYYERPLLRWLPCVLALLCAVTEFGVSAEINHIRPSTFGPGTPADAASRFSQLHLLSRTIFGAVLAGVGVLTVLHALAGSDSPQGRE